MARKKIGTVGIDAGMLYLGDPCYVIGAPLGQKLWEDFLRDLYATSDKGLNGTHWTAQSFISPAAQRSFPAGIVCRTGEGDGEYPVYADIVDGVVKSVTVRFVR